MNVCFDRDSFSVLRIAPLLKFLIVCFNKSCLISKVIIACLFKLIFFFFFFFFQERLFHWGNNIILWLFLDLRV